MAKCRIDGNSIAKGITNLLDRELLNSTIFEKEGSFYVTKPTQHYEAQVFASTINRRFSEDVIRKVSDTRYEIRISNTLLKQYVVSTSEGQEADTLVGLYGDFHIDLESWNKDEMFSFLNYPEITTMTMGKLKEFLLSINPKFKVQDVDNLSVPGVTLLKDFLIKVRTTSKYSAMPEEVAHVAIEFLPDDNPLKQELITNVVNFPIYSQTLSRYKDEYTLPDGHPDYNKIKREAAAKLVGEYVTAISNDDYTRVNILAATKQGWLTRWFSKFIKWLGFNMLNKTKAYADLAGLILSGKLDTTLKTAKDIEDLSYTDSYFFRQSEEQLYETAHELIIKNPPRLLENITNFSKEFGRKFNEILKEERFAELNTELKRVGHDIGKINRLIDIKDLLGEVKIDLKAAMDTDSYLKGVKQFLEAVDRLDILSESLLKVINNKEKAKTFDEAIKNIKELEAYFSIYETFKNIIAVDLAQTLVDSGVATDMIQSILRTQSNFDIINRHILSKLKGDLAIFYKGMLSDVNQGVTAQLEQDLELAKKLGNKKIIKEVEQKMKNLVASDEDIIKMLSGKGKDIDNFSALNHWLSAAYVNGDLYISGVAKYIKNKIERDQTKGAIVIRNLYDRIDPIQKALGEDAVTTGKTISFVDKVFDRDQDEERDVLSWLHPHKNIHPILDFHKRAVQDSLDEYTKIDENNEVEKNAVWEKYNKVRKDYSDFLAKYMNRPFVKEYYDFRKKYDEDPIFTIAMEEYRALTSQITNDEEFLKIEPENEDIAKGLAVLYRERSNKLHEVDLNGYPKNEEELKKVTALKQYFEESGKYKEEDEVQTERTYLIFRNRYEQRVDFALQQVRESKPKTIEDVEKKLQEVMKNPRIRITTNYNFEYPDVGEIDYKYVKNLMMEKWYKKNVTIQRNEKFVQDEAELRKELEELQKRGEMTPIEMEIFNKYKEIRDILFGTRDVIGHINPDSLTEQQKNMIQDLEDDLDALKQERPGIGIDLTDLTDEDRARYDALSAVIGDPSTDSRRKIMALRERNRIAKKYKNTGKNKAIKELINLLGSLTENSATQYYWDKMETFIPSIAEFVKDIHELDLSETIKQSANDFYNEFVETVDTQDWDALDFNFYEKELFKDFLDWLAAKEPIKFKWFTQNHSEKTVFDHENGYYTKIKYARGAVYTYKSPSLAEHQKITYNKKYRKNRVKDEYRTGYNPSTKKVELKVGTHITNREYNGFPEFLPLLPEQGAPADSPYRNEAYYKLHDSENPQDQLRFKYLETLKGAHLLEQEKLPARLRTWMQVPVMSHSHIEEKMHIPDVAKANWNKVKTIFQKNVAGEAEAQTDEEDTSKEIDQFTQVTISDRIPKLGMSQKLDIDRVSRDLLKSTAQFILRAHEFEGRSEASPVVKALIRVLGNTETANTFKGASNKQRLQILEKIYSQMILQEVPGGVVNNKAMRRIAKILTANTALRMVADPIGGIINYSSAMVNNIIEASAGKYLNLAELAKGKVLSYEVNFSLLADYNKKSNLSYYTLLFDTFDFIQGDFEEDLLDRSSSKDKHASIRQMLMIPRKSGELVAQTAIAMGMLERTKVENTIDGKSYPVHQIYEKYGNNLRLKAGFPEEWNPVDGQKFEKMRDLIHRVNYELHGNYAKLTQTEASRYAIGKLAENMKRWFMPAFQRRFGRETPDITFEELNEGYYTTTGKAAQKIFGALFRFDWGGAKDQMSYFMNIPRYKQNLQRMAAEMVQAVILFLIFAVLLGYSGPDKNKKLEQNSWIHNTSILLALRIYSETTAYQPFPQVGPFFGGFQELKRNVLTPFSLPADAVSNFAAIAQLGLYQVLYWMGADSLHNDLFYSKNAGYWYSEKGRSKLLKYIIRSAGVTGYTIEPAPYIKTFDSLQKRLK